MASLGAAADGGNSTTASQADRDRAAAAADPVAAAATPAAAAAEPVPPERPWGDASLQQLRAALQLFADERDWQQYHSPRNLLLALMGECGELAEVRFEPLLRCPLALPCHCLAHTRMPSAAHTDLSMARRGGSRPSRLHRRRAAARGCVLACCPARLPLRCCCTAPPATPRLLPCLPGRRRGAERRPVLPSAPGRRVRRGPGRRGAAQAAAQRSQVPGEPVPGAQRQIHRL